MQKEKTCFVIKTLQTLLWKRLLSKIVKKAIQDHSYVNGCPLQNCFSGIDQFFYCEIIDHTNKINFDNI